MLRLNYRPTETECLPLLWVILGRRSLYFPLPAVLSLTFWCVYHCVMSLMRVLEIAIMGLCLKRCSFVFLSMLLTRAFSQSSTAPPSCLRSWAESRVSAAELLVSLELGSWLMFLVSVLMLAGRPGQSLRAVKVLWNDLRPVARIKFSRVSELKTQ